MRLVPAIYHDTCCTTATSIQACYPIVEFSSSIIIIITIAPKTVKTFSDDIHMEFGLEKCAKIAFKRGKLVHSQNLVIDINRDIQELEQGKKRTSASRLRKVKAYNINK